MVRVLQPRHQVGVVQLQPHVTLPGEPDEYQVHRHRHVHRLDGLDPEVGRERRAGQVPSPLLVLRQRLLSRLGPRGGAEERVHAVVVPDDVGRVEAAVEERGSRSAHARTLSTRRRVRRVNLRARDGDGAEP